MVPFSLRLGGAVAAAILIGGTASAAPRIEARTRLHHCGEKSCLLVTGRRPDAAEPVMLAGHSVPVLGERNWRVSVPLETLRTWFLSDTRAITVRIGGNEFAASLPIGLLRSNLEFASLEVRAR